MDINANLNSLMEEAQKMQERMEQAQKELAALEVVGKAGNDVVIRMNGRHEVLDVSINPEMLKQAPEMLEAKIAAALNNATREVERVSKEKIAQLTAGLNLAADLLKDDSKSE